MVVQHTAAAGWAAAGLGLAGVSRWLRVLVAVCAMAGCTPLSERTQVKISIDADASLRARIVQVDAELRLGRDVDRGYVTRTEHLRASGAKWPLTLLLARADNAADNRYQLSAFAKGVDGHAIAVAKASSAFVDGRTLELGLHFDAECADRAEDCPEQTSCQGGRCMSAFVAPETLPGAGPMPSMLPVVPAADGGTASSGASGSCSGASCVAADSCEGGLDPSCAPLPLALVVEGARLEPEFSPELTEYQLQLPLRSEQVHVRVEVPPLVRLAIDGRPLVGGERWSTAAPAFGDERSVTVSLSHDGHGSRKLQLQLVRRGEVLGFVKASNPGAGDELGRVIAASGDTLVVGAPLEDGSVRSTAHAPDDGTKDSGAVYVFVREPSGALRQEAYLKAEAPRENAQFGVSVAIDGDRLVVGASLDGSGSAHVFERRNGAWSRVKVLTPDAAGGNTQRFGAAVALTGDTIAVGASTETTLSSDSGAVYVFERGTGDYASVVKLKAKTPGPLDWFGSAVVLTQDLLIGVATGAIPSGLASSGVLHVFMRGTAGWEERQALPPADGTACAFFGQAVAVSGNTLATSCWNASAERPAGAVYLYERGADGKFEPSGVLSAAAAQSGDAFGRGIALQGDTLLVGAPFEHSAGRGIGGRETGALEESGAAYLFTRQGGAWRELVKIKAPEPFAKDGMGNSVALGGRDVFYVAASQDGGAGSGVDAVQAVRGAATSGAVHVFR